MLSTGEEQWVGTGWGVFGGAVEEQPGPGVPGCCCRQCTTKPHLSARVSKEPRLSVCRLAQRLISQSASLSLRVPGRWWVRPPRGAAGELWSCCFQKGREFSPVTRRMGSGVLSFRAFMCSQVVAEHLLAGLASPSPFVAALPCLSRG